MSPDRYVKNRTVRRNSLMKRVFPLFAATVFLMMTADAGPAHSGDDSAQPVPLYFSDSVFHVGDSPASTLLLPPGPQENWEPVSQFDFSRMNGETAFWLKFRLPPFAPEDTSVLLSAFVKGFRAYLDEELIYAYGKESEAYGHDFTYHMSHVIPLGPLVPGRTLAIRIVCDGRAGVGELYSLVLGSATDLPDIMIAERDDLYRRSIVDVCLGFLLAVMGVASMGIFTIRLRQRNWPFLSFGLFALFSGATYLTDSSAIFFLNVSPSTQFYFNSLSFLLVPPALFAFADHMFQTPYRTLIRGLWIGHLLFAVLAVFLIRQGIDYTFGFLSVLVVNCSVCMGIILKSGDAADRLIRTSFLVFFAWFIVLILLYVLELMNLIPRAYDVFGWGLLAFVSSLGFFLLRHYTRTFYTMQTVSLELERNKSELLEIQKEQLKSQLEALKHQLDPHFLFNNFSTLSAIIDEDKDTAVAFVQELSKVYRYVLQTRDHTLVDLSEEIGFLESYRFLMSKRFGDNLVLSIDVPEACMTLRIMPFALQLLVENAVKHNVVSQKKPLIIDVAADARRVYVTNRLQKKNQVIRSTGIGLSNIMTRYSLITDQSVDVIETESAFNVSIPLLERNGDYDERFDH